MLLPRGGFGKTRCPSVYYASDKPGLGMDLDEKLAARFPIKDDPPFDLNWGNGRRDGVKP